jgi:choline dehydrogenase
MTYLRGDAAVFDAWEKLGNKGWNWKSMLPYFKKSERFTPPNDVQIAAGATYKKEPHGYSGNIRVGYENTFVANNLAPAATETWNKLGYSQCPDFNAGKVHGYAVAPQTRDSNKPLRWDSVVSYYSPVEHRKNLKIVKGTVRSITWKKAGKKDSCKLVIANGVGQGWQGQSNGRQT